MIFSKKDSMKRCLKYRRKVLDMSLSSVGLHLGGRDHTTIMHAQRKIESLIKKDKKFKRRVDIVYNELNLN